MKLDEAFSCFSLNQEQPSFITVINKLAILEFLLPKITHEINNALSFIQLELETLQTNFILQKKLDRITELSYALQRLALEKEGLTCFQLNDCLNEALLIASAATKNKILCKKKLASLLPPLKHDFHQLKRAFINIILQLTQGFKKSAKPGVLRVTTKKHKKNLQLLFCIQGSQVDEKAETLGLSRKIIEEQGGRMKIETLDEEKLKFKIHINLPAQL